MFQQLFAHAALEALRMPTLAHGTDNPSRNPSLTPSAEQTPSAFGAKRDLVHMTGTRIPAIRLGRGWSFVFEVDHRNRWRPLRAGFDKLGNVDHRSTHPIIFVLIEIVSVGKRNHRDSNLRLYLSLRLSTLRLRKRLSLLYSRRLRWCGCRSARYSYSRSMTLSTFCEYGINGRGCRERRGRLWRRLW